MLSRCEIGFSCDIAQFAKNPNFLFLFAGGEKIRVRVCVLGWKWGICKGYAGSLFCWFSVFPGCLAGEKIKGF